MRDGVLDEGLRACGRREADVMTGNSPEKRKRISVIVVVAAVLLLLAALTCFVIWRSYYPMDGEVRIQSKEQSNGFTVTIQQGFRDGQKQGQFRLKCTEEQFDSVEIGDIVDCSRTQSALTHRGAVHRFH